LLLLADLYVLRSRVQSSGEYGINSVIEILWLF